MAIDLHVHTTASDGIHTPGEVVEMAVKLGLLAIAITDHDSTDGIDMALEVAQNRPLKIIPGIELNTDENEVHILGYYIDWKDPDLQETLNQLRQVRINRFREIVEKLEAINLPVSMERVLELAGDGAVGRPHIARVMIENGYVNSVPEAFDLYLATGKPAFVPHKALSPMDAVELIIKYGGIPVLAHPGLHGKDELIKQLLLLGLKGIEVYHPDHNAEIVEHYTRIAQENGLIITGGTDFHGVVQAHTMPLGGIVIPDKLAEILENHR